MAGLKRQVFSTCWSAALSRLRLPLLLSTVTLTVDESTYAGAVTGPDHALAWYRQVDAGRAYYTALGHPPEAWSDPEFVEHVLRAIVWAGAK